jgi:hypothetical protein
MLRRNTGSRFHSQIQNRPLIRGTVFGRQRFGMIADQQRHMTHQPTGLSSFSRAGAVALGKEKPAG